MAKRGGKRRDPARERLWRRTIRDQERSGLTVRAFCKRLEKGSFRFPASTPANGSKGVEVKAADLMMILHGVDLGSVRRQRRYERQHA